MEHYTKDQFQAEREKLLGEARLIKSRMLRLKEDDGFKYYHEQLQIQYESRLNSILGMPKNAAEVVQRTHAIGEMAGIKLALDYIEVLIAYAQTSIDSANYAEEQEKRNGESNSEGRTASAGGTGFDFDDNDTDFDASESGHAYRAP